MSGLLLGIVLVILSSAVEGIAQVCLKRHSMAQSEKFRWISLGVVLFVIEALLYTGALQRLDVSTAYPMGALSFVFVTLFSLWLLKERVDAIRWLGLALIIAGTTLLAL